MCTGGCGGCANRCGVPEEKEINVKNLHESQIAQIKALFVNYIATTKEFIADAPANYDIERIVQKGRIVTVALKSPNDPDNLASFRFQL